MDPGQQWISQSSHTISQKKAGILEAAQPMMPEDEMLTGHDMIYFGPDAWHGLLRPRHQLMAVFARCNRVVYVEGRRHLRPTLAGFRRGDLKLSDLRRSSVQQVSQNLFVFRYPIWAPISGCFPLGQFTRSIRRLSLRNALRGLQISQPIVFFLRPSMIDLFVDVPSARLFLYHIEDEYTAYGGVTPARRRRIEERERKMMAQVDLAIAVSRKLYEAKRHLNPNTYLVPNGVDYQSYAAALAAPQFPSELRKIRRPRLGYSGLIADKLDLDMLKQVAQENPEWSLVFLGKASVSKQAETWRALLAMPNVHHLGPVEGARVPLYVKGFDVGLMPYVQNRHADYISPMKLYDYLAAGLPVASLDFPAAREFEQHIHLADSPWHFSQAVRRALADRTPERRQARMNIAAQHSWEARVEQLSELIEAQLSAKISNT